MGPACGKLDIIKLENLIAHSLAHCQAKQITSQHNAIPCHAAVKWKMQTNIEYDHFYEISLLITWFLLNYLAYILFQTNSIVCYFSVISSFLSIFYDHTFAISMNAKGACGQELWTHHLIQNRLIFCSIRTKLLRYRWRPMISSLTILIKVIKNDFNN